MFKPFKVKRIYMTFEKQTFVMVSALLISLPMVSSDKHEPAANMEEKPVVVEQTSSATRLETLVEKTSTGNKQLLAQFLISANRKHYLVATKREIDGEVFRGYMSIHDGSFIGTQQAPWWMKALGMRYKDAYVIADKNAQQCAVCADYNDENLFSASRTVRQDTDPNNTPRNCGDFSTNPHSSCALLKEAFLLVEEIAQSQEKFKK